jgi:hypothetical protein
MLSLTPIYLNICENCKKLKCFLKIVTKIKKLKLHILGMQSPMRQIFL